MSILPGRTGPIATGRLRGGILSAARPLPLEYDSWRQGVTFNSACVSDDTRLWYCTDPSLETPCVNAVFWVSLNNPEGGDYTLTFDPTGADPQTTGDIAYDGGAAALTTAFNALSNVDPGDFIYTEDEDGFNMLITAASDGQYGCQEIDPDAITIDCTGLTWAFPPPSCGDVNQTVQGAPAVEQPVKASDDTGDVVTFEPFIAYAEQDCSTWMRPEELRALAQVGFDRTLSRGVAQQLQSNPLAVNGSTSPSLNDSADDVTPVGGPSDVVNTLSGLINSAQCECGLTDIVFHVPLRSLPFFIEKQIVDWDESRAVWHMGPYDFSFDCYSETGPGDVETDADGSEIWIYATGPVEFGIGPMYEPTERDSIVVLQNERTALIEHLALIRFDPCCVLAARAVIS